MSGEVPTNPPTGEADGARDQWRWTSRGFAPGTSGLSRLAVLESLVATGVMLWATYHYELYLPLEIALFTVPFALLRTEESDKRTTRYALKLLKRSAAFASVEDDAAIHHSAFSIRAVKRSLSLFFFTGLVLIVAVLARLASLCVSLTTDFWKSIGAAPSNWKRICLGVDILRPVEILPGQSGYPPNDTIARQIKSYSERQQSLIGNGGVVGAIIAFYFVVKFVAPTFIVDRLWLNISLLIAVLFIFILVVYMIPFFTAYFVAFWYRWSLKSTSLLWLPLLYIASDVDSPGWSVDRRLKRIQKGTLPNDMRWFGLVTSLMTLGYLALKVTKAKLYTYLHEHVPFFDYFFGGPVAVVVGSWSIASLVNTVLAWVQYWLVDRELDRRAHNEGFSDATTLRILKTVGLIRWFLFILSWICSAYIFYTIIRDRKPVDIDFDWFPW